MIHRLRERSFQLAKISDWFADFTEQLIFIWN